MLNVYICEHLMIDLMKHVFNAILLLMGINSYAQSCGVTVSVPKNTIICQPTGINLDGKIEGNYLSFEWKGADGYSNNTELNPTVNVAQSTTYTLTSYSVPAINLINNGDFSSGVTGFSTDYTYVSTSMMPEGRFAVINNPNLVHTRFATCKDHSGNGNMMVVNGAALLQKVWCQNIDITPGKTYIFQAWATSVIATSPAILQFSINGSLIGPPLNLSGGLCGWEKFYTTWDSGANSNVEICITNQNTTPTGNDFAIDDIFFAPLCEDEKKFTVTLSPFQLPVPSTPHLDCFNRNSVLSAIPISGSGPFSYAWTTVDGNIETSVAQESITVSSSGTYFVTVTDQYGCSRTSPYVVTEDFAPTIPKIDGNTGFYCLKDSVELMVSASTPVSSYVWLLPDFTTLSGNAITATQGGKYIVTATGNNGCLGVDSITLSSFELPMPSTPHLDCFNRNSVLSAVPISGSGPFSYAWTTVDGNIVTSVAQESITVTSSGTYFVTVTDQYGCSRTSPYVVTGDFAPTIPKIDGNTGFYCLKDSVELMVSASTPVSSYVWLLPDFTTLSGNAITATQGGKYIVTAIGNNGCMGVDSITLSSFELPMPSTPHLDCFNWNSVLSAVPISGSGIFSYAWATVDGNIETSVAQESITVTSSGTYFVTVTDQYGCSRTSPYVVTGDFAPPLPVISGNTVLDCVVKSTELTVTASNPSATFEWLLPDNTIKTGNMITATMEGKYQVIATGNNGCRDTLPYFLTADRDFPIISADLDTITCTHPMGNILLMSSVMSDFSWRDEMGNTGIGPNIISTKPGVYAVTATSSRGCESTQMITLDIDTISPKLEILLLDSITCAVPVVKPSILAADHTLFYWQGPENVNITTLAPIFDVAGLYTLTLQGANGCMKSESITVVENKKAPDFDITYDDLTCKEPATKLIISGDQDVLYKLDTSQISNNHMITKAGNYTLTGTNHLGCESVLNFIVQANFELPVSEIKPIKLNCINKTGLLYNTYVGTDDYQYTWIRDSEKYYTDSLSVSNGGIIFVEIANPYGCILKDTITISEDKVIPELTISGNNVIPCDSVFIQLSANPASPDYILYWTDPDGLTDSRLKIQASKAGLYTSHITNPANGCSNEKSINIIKHFPIDSYVSVLKQPLCLGDKGSINVKQLIGGTAPYKLMINSQPKILESDFAVPAGSIFVEVSDANGCYLKDTLYVNEPVPFVVDAGADVLIELYGSHKIEANVEMNGNKTEQIIWTPAESLSCDDCLSPLATPLEDTKYKITIINQNGCKQEDELLVRVIFNKGYDSPNIISNEGNTGNIYFTIYPIRNSINKLQYLRIYDRWGNMVFTKENFPAGTPEEGWDGSISGKRVQPGVYVWVSEILYKDGTSEVARGDVSILR
jgi:CHU_C Type IX secretion signal domain